ncbi:MAG: HAD-IC family P-type ATPase [Verrucomicrobiales bacterium]|nr:HAD-IC family P-type ATPase [Verrucomicrobiales bacterium]
MNGLGHGKHGLEDLVGHQLGKRVRHAHVEPQGLRRRPLLDRVHQLSAQREDLLGVAAGDLTGVRQHLRPPAPAEELLAQRLLQLAQLRRDGRRGDVELLGGLLQAAFLRHGPEVPQVVVVDAVEVVLDRCQGAGDAQGQPVKLDRERILGHVSTLASAGLRVLAFARAEMPPDTARLHVYDLPRQFAFLGLQAMMDPPRREARDAVTACHQAGIRVKMITGDHAGTAVAIGRQLGLGAALPLRAPPRSPAHSGAEAGGNADGEEVPRKEASLAPAPPAPAALTGKDLAALDDAQLIEVAENVSVFARVSPEQKLRLVRALQARGHVVAMTGDGVNDGPALKQADIGIAMGITGTEVAKEASDMVLTDDNFASIRAAVEEGRNVFDNLTKIITWALPSNLGQGLVILAAALVGATLPILPIQILWINMTTGGVLGLFLALEAKEPDLMQRPPRAPSAPILTGQMLAQVSLVGLLILLAAFGLFQWELARGAGVEAARTVALNTVAVIQAFYLVNCRSLRHSVLAVGLFRNGWLWLGILGVFLLQAAITYLPFLNKVFKTTAIGWDEWLRIVGAGLAAMIVVELHKALVAGRSPKNQAPRPLANGTCAATR